jgi:hypothetical protein
VRLVFLALTLTFVAALTPAAQQTRSVERAVEARYHAAHTLKADFYESYDDGSVGMAAEAKAADCARARCAPTASA